MSILHVLCSEKTERFPCQVTPDAHIMRTDGEKLFKMGDSVLRKPSEALPCLSFSCVKDATNDHVSAATRGDGHYA